MTIEFIDPTTVTANSDQCGDIDDANVDSLVAVDADDLPPAVVVREWMEVRDGCHRREAAIKACRLLKVIFITSAEYKELRADGVIDCELTETLC